MNKKLVNPAKLIGINRLNETDCPSFSEDDFIIESNPTPEDIDCAEKEGKIVLCCRPFPKDLDEINASLANVTALNQAWLIGFLEGRNLKRSSYMIVYLHDEKFESEKVAEVLIKHVLDGEKRDLTKEATNLLLCTTNVY